MRALALSLLALVACDAYDEDIGPTPFYCGPGDQCPSGYTCQDDPVSGKAVCVASDDSISNNFDCADDSDMEPNNMLAEAAMTPVDSSKTFTVDGRAICPAGDRDLYAVTITTNSENLEATIVYEAGGIELTAAILNTGGVPIQRADGVDTRTLRASARNLPAGLYYVQVVAELSGGSLQVNNYELSLAVTGP